jgi:hypothetical protein
MKIDYNSMKVNFFVLLSLFTTSCASFSEIQIEKTNFIPTPPPVEIASRIYNADQIDVLYGGNACRVHSWDEAFGYLGKSISQNFRNSLRRKPSMFEQHEADDEKICKPDK